MTVFRHIAQGTHPLGDSWTFSLHTEGAVSLTSAQAQWVTASGSLWTGALDAHISTGMSMTAVATASINETTGGQISREEDGVVRPGVSASAILPPQVALCVSLRTAEATRAGRGRFFLPSLVAAATLDGRLTNTARGDVLAAAVAMFGDLVTGGLTPILWGRTAKTKKVVTQIDVGSLFDTQRRRRNDIVEERISATI